MCSGSFKDIINKMCLEIIYLIYMYKKDLALNNLQWLIYHKTKQNLSTMKICTGTKILFGKYLVEY